MKTAVCLHIYYEEQLPELLGYLKNIRDFELFVTCRPEIVPTVEGPVKAAFPEARISEHPNFGMDILPFLFLVREYGLADYDAVLKIHTKNTSREDAFELRRNCLEGLCGSRRLTAQIRRLFAADPQAGLVGPVYALRSAQDLMYRNRSTVGELLKILAVKLADWNFFVGSMFWIAGPLLAPLADLYPLLAAKSSREKSATLGDGTMAHALERVFGVLAPAAGRTVHVTEPAAFKGRNYLLTPLTRHGPAQSRLFRCLPFETQTLRSRRGGVWADKIRASSYWDPGYYAAEASRRPVPGLDLARHYIMYGDLFSLDPSERFSTSFYLNKYPWVQYDGYNPLFYYLEYGRRKNRIARPTAEDWTLLAAERDIRAADLLEMPGLKKVDYKSYFKIRPREYFFYLSLNFAHDCHDYPQVEKLQSDILGEFGETRPLLLSRAVTAAMTGQWSLAEELWTRLAQTDQTAPLSSRDYSSCVAEGRTLLSFGPNEPVAAIRKILRRLSPPGGPEAPIFPENS